MPSNTYKIFRKFTVLKCQLKGTVRMAAGVVAKEVVGDFYRKILKIYCCLCGRESGLPCSVVVCGWIGESSVVEILNTGAWPSG